MESSFPVICDIIQQNAAFSGGVLLCIGRRYASIYSKPVEYSGREKGKRHPTLGNNITVSAGAKLLGSFTVGDNVKIGGGSVVLRDIPANCTVVGVPGRIVRRDGLPVELTYDEEIDIEEEEAMVDLNHQQLPDPEMDLIRHLEERIALLEARVSLQHEQLMDQMAAEAHRKKEEIICRS